jgi:hypothetical protein
MSIGQRVGEAPVSLTFFDGASRVHGMARVGLTLIFEGATPSMAAGPTVERTADGYRATVDDTLELEFTLASEAAQLAGSRIHVCRVSGRAKGRPIDCMGTAAETLSPPEWEELDALRAVSALFDSDHAVLAVARRPRGAPGHGRELITAALLTGGELRSVEDARLSTVYDGDGRQRSAGMELWMPGEDFPRRLAGEVAGGTTLELPGLQVNASVFDWRMEGREGMGSYEVTVRDEPQAAA